MSTIERSIEVDAPLSTVYNQWTQFEEFPRFMDGVEEVRQVDDTHLHWIAEFGGSRPDWDADRSGCGSAGAGHFRARRRKPSRDNVIDLG